MITFAKTSMNKIIIFPFALLIVLSLSVFLDATENTSDRPPAGSEIQDITTVDLTPDEKDYLNNTIFKRHYIGEWMPFNFYSSDGEAIGIAEDYWKLIKGKIGLEEKMHEQITFAELLELMQQKKVDLYPATTKTKDREQYALFSVPYENYPIAIAARPNSFLSNASSLSGRIVSVGKNYSAYHMMRKKHPNIKCLQVRNAEEAIKKIISGEAYAAIDILPVLQYHIHNFGDTKVTFAGVTDINFPLQVMIHRDHYRLLPLINKAIKSITHEERTKISKNWIQKEIIQKIDYSLIWKISFFSFVFLSFVLFWNRKLHKAKKEVEISRLQLQKAQQKLREKNKELEQLAIIDKLTGIYNRGKLDEFFQNEIDRAKRYNYNFGVALVDIDHFKSVNDTYGHQIGDTVLVEMAKIFKTFIRNTDIVGRWGGEEFVIICPEASESDMLKLSENIRKKIEKHQFSYVGRKTASFGVSSYRTGDTVKSLTKRVDDALYDAKKNGRNKVVRFV